MTWRYLSGAHMDGISRSNAGWVTRGTRPAAGQTRITGWACLSRAERAAVRLLVTGGAGLAGWGEMTHPAATDHALAGTAVAAGITAAGATGRGALNWRHRRNWIRPLHLVLEKPLGLPDGVRPQSYLRIPRDYPTRTDVGRIKLPPEWGGENRAAVASLVKEKLGLSDVSVTFHMKGRTPYAELRQTPRPRGKAMFSDSDVRQLVAAAAESAPLIGLGPQDRVISVDLDAESPHVLVSASTGGGKSVITRTMVSQMLHNGGQAVVLDFKRHSHKWCRGLPSVRYCRDIGEIHRALVELGAEGHRRNIVVDEWDGSAEAPVGPRMGILLEEANATISKLKRYWAAVRDKDDPKESPAIDGLREILYMGRAVKMHVLLVAQSATANALGGPEVRECFAVRILSRYTRNAWNMLVPEVQPIPRSTRHVGRAQVVLGGVAHETQVAFFTDREARDWALSGTVAAPIDGHQEHGQGDTSRGAEGSSSHVTGEPLLRDVAPPRLTLVKGGPEAQVVPPMPQTPPQVKRYTLAEACREGIVPLKPDALRSAKKRDTEKGEFPEGENGRWTAEELTRWYRNRPSTKEIETAAGE
jgi:hypothetical protein